MRYVLRMRLTKQSNGCIIIANKEEKDMYWKTLNIQLQNGYYITPYGDSAPIFGRI